MLMGPDAPPPKGRSVVHRVTAHLRSNLVGWVALFVALGGTGYAAASHAHSNTINACANKKTGQLSIRHGAHCKRGQVKVSWAKQGPRGPAGTSAIQAFGAVGATGIVIPNGGISIQHTGPGVFVVTATSAGCANGLNDSDRNGDEPEPVEQSRRRGQHRTCGSTPTAAPRSSPCIRVGSAAAPSPRPTTGSTSRTPALPSGSGH